MRLFWRVTAVLWLVTAVSHAETVWRLAWDEGAYTLGLAWLTGVVVVPYYMWTSK